MLVILTLHTFCFSLSEILFTDGLVCRLVPPVWLFAEVPDCVTLVSVDVVTVRLNRVAENTKLVGHCLNELSVLTGWASVAVVFEEQRAYLSQSVDGSVFFTVTACVLVA